MAGAGKVYLLGAGPGAVDLITVRGAAILARAEVIVYDFLSNEELLHLAPENAQRIYAGKRGGSARAMEQEEINRLLIEKARTARTVVRLKGGDPFIFGRGGEEALALVRAGVPFEVVPGVTSAIAVPAFAGIPLTHRDYGSFVAFITGHEEENRSAGQEVPWADLARAAVPRGTLVLLMATARLRSISAQLLAAGMPPETPAAAIRQGTLAEQRTVSTTLGGLADAAEAAGLNAPAIVVIGAVARLREQLRWVERQPLFGRRIIITRSREQAAGLAQRLRELGAEVHLLPTIRIGPPDSFAALDEAIGKLSSYNWIVFTSANGVERFVQRLADSGHDVREMSGAALAAIGPATARRLRDFGLRAAAMPEEYRAEAIVAAIGAERLMGARILIPRAQVAREALLDLLRDSGAAEVAAVAAYKTELPRPEVLGRLTRLLHQHKIDLVTFTSSSTVNNFCSIMGEAASGQPAAVIGPITAQTAAERGLEVVARAKDYTVDGLFDAICGYFTGRGVAP
jgi:uroporphyrinogen III methyltransferase/synthase